MIEYSISSVIVGSSNAIIESIIRAVEGSSNAIIESVIYAVGGSSNAIESRFLFLVELLDDGIINKNQNSGLGFFRLNW